ncbi:Fungal specific transcription factor domain containing protein, partial [Elaphomyces granulatus]
SRPFYGICIRSSLNKSMKALVFAIYLSAVIGMTPEQCRSYLEENRHVAIQRYRFYVEQALARADLLDLTLLQAMVLFLISVGGSEGGDTQFVWSMTSVVVRHAQGLGLHLDGADAGLTPFDTEMRRRLWWHISVLDVWSAEKYGIEPIIHLSSYTTRFPLVIDDDDFGPASTELPTERRISLSACICT